MGKFFNTNSVISREDVGRGKKKIITLCSLNLKLYLRLVGRLRIAIRLVDLLVILVNLRENNLFRTSIKFLETAIII